MRVIPLHAVLHDQRQRSCCLCNQLHRAKSHRVRQKPGPRQRAGIPRTPCRPAMAGNRHQRTSSRGFDLWHHLRAPSPLAEEFKHRHLLGPAARHSISNVLTSKSERSPPPPPARQRRGATPYRLRIRGACQPCAGPIISSCSAQTSASTRSGDPDPTKPPVVIRHI